MGIEAQTQPETGTLSATSDVVLRAREVKKHFPVKLSAFQRTQLRAVDGVSLDIRRGETVGVVGESGCGKSTLARLLVGLLTPTDGAVEYEGKTIDPASRRSHRELTRHLQIVFQDPFASLNPWMSVGEAISRPMVVHGLGDKVQRRQRIKELLESVGLAASAARKLPHQFSGGQRQRIAIARALAPDPDVIVGDEVTSALDVSVQATILNLLRDLQNEFKLTYVLISHDMRVIEYMCDRVAVMYLGKIVEFGSAKDVFRRPGHPYTRQLLASVPGVSLRGSAKAQDSMSEPPSPLRPPSGCSFHPRCPYTVEACRVETPLLRRPGTAQLIACDLAEQLPVASASAGISETERE